MINRIPQEGLKSHVPFHFPYTDGTIRTGLEDECTFETWAYYADDKMAVVHSYQNDFADSGIASQPIPYYRLSDFNGYIVDNSMGRGLRFQPFFYDNNKEKADFGFAVSTNNNGIYNLNSSENYEFEIWGNYSDTIGNYFTAEKAITAAIPTLTKDNKELKLILEHEDNQENTINDLRLGIWSTSADNTWKTQITLTSTIWNVNAEESQTITIPDEDYQADVDGEGLSLGDRKYNSLWIKNPNSWIYFMLRITNNTAIVYIDGYERLRAVLPANATLHPTRLKIGGLYGLIRNYAFWHKAGTEAPTIPSSIYPSTLNVNEFGGFGSGANGDKVISSNTTNFNTCGQITNVTDMRTFTINSWAGGNSGVSASQGCEVMIHITKPKQEKADEWPYLGMYVFRKIRKIDGKTITLNRSICEGTDGFTLSQELASKYYIQVIVVPNYRTFTLNANITVTPVTWSTLQGGGIIVLRTTGDCTINGNIRTQDYGAVRLYDNHTMSHSTLLNRFLCCRGGGIIIVCGSKLTLGSTSILGGSIKPTNTGYNADKYTGQTGRGACYLPTRALSGYTSLLSNKNWYRTEFDKVNRVSPGKDYFRSSSSPEYASGGACLIIIANFAVIDKGAIQTGGFANSSGSSNLSKGGGGGFCYMAIGEFLDG